MIYWDDLPWWMKFGIAWSWASAVVFVLMMIGGIIAAARMVAP